MDCHTSCETSCEYCFNEAECIDSCMLCNKELCIDCIIDAGITICPECNQNNQICENCGCGSSRILECSGCNGNTCEHCINDIGAEYFCSSCYESNF